MKLSWQLLRIGWAAGRGARGDRIRLISLTLATLTLTLLTLAMAVTTVMFGDRLDRDEDRRPLPTAKGTTATALYSEAPDVMRGRPVVIVMVVPLDLSAPPPPGLSRWPAPGEAFLSASMIRMGGADHIRSRYGRFAGVIAPSGLASPSELFVYVNPVNADRDSTGWEKIAGFGNADRPPIGEQIETWPLSQVLLTLGCLAGVPCLALLVVALRCGSAGRDRRGALLTALGASVRHRALVDVGETAPAAVLGALLGVGIFAAVTATGDLTLPLTGYRVGQRDLVASWGVVPEIIAATVGMVLVLAVLLRPPKPVSGATRPHVHAAKVPRWRIALFVIMIAGVAISGNLHGSAGLYTYVTATIGLWTTLPSVAGMAGRRLGLVITRFGWRRGVPAPIIAGRWISAHPGVVVRLSTALVIGLGLITQLQVWVSRLDEPARAAVETQQRIGDRVLLVDVDGIPRTQALRFTRRLPDGFDVLALRTAEGKPTVLSGSCAVLQRLRLSCPAAPAELSGGTGDARAEELWRWRSAPEGGMRVRTVPEADLLGTGPTTLVVVSDDPREAWRVKEAAFAELGVSVDGLGSDYGGGGADLARLGQWVVLFGSAGLLVLMLTAAVGTAAEFLRFGAALAPLAVQADRRWVYLSVALWNLTVPLLLSVLLGGIVTAWHGSLVIAQIGQGEFSWAILSSTMSAAVVLSVAIGLLGGLTAARSARSWRPTAD